ncbi:hypothetical protein ACFFQW_49365 [Umezawaea endophytica]|uniref:Uncharacterized protein n=1 Tax=Umezawaea endophytica TaxID=1654476 RepID=A0A9X2VFM8_9PSEU|nr:hypothetical protein [Umezawaea endophytica]MCS7475746.1 hypothetical protein [Umezawaea endophytica]
MRDVVCAPAQSGVQGVGCADLPVPGRFAVVRVRGSRRWTA